ncbi:optic atrophy 3 protein homolog [Papaver somniferum]|nr:optic atrophy 3 protein homolog [Papaver somniferum]
MKLPVVKLGILAVRTMCKPVANRLKAAAGKHPRFREYIINIAQTNHRLTTIVQRRIYGHATDVAIRPLNEHKAVQAAAELLGEVFVFSVAGAAIIFEVQRSARSEARKEELRRQEKEKLERELESIRGELAELKLLAKAQGLPPGIYNLRNLNGNENAKSGSEIYSETDARTTEDPKSAPPAHSTKATKQSASTSH